MRRGWPSRRTLLAGTILRGASSEGHGPRSTRSRRAGGSRAVNAEPVMESVPAGQPPPPPDAGGVTCLLQGYYECSAGSWCSLGVCPDGTTQYGCYCNQDGTATCQVNCPIPPPCDIPGQGACPYGAQCVYGTCASNPSGTALVCSCNRAGSAYCYTSPCGGLDGGPGFLDGGPAGRRRRGLFPGGI